jgi:hypothetical protein
VRTFPLIPAAPQGKGDATGRCVQDWGYNDRRA